MFCFWGPKLNDSLSVLELSVLINSPMYSSCERSSDVVGERAHATENCFMEIGAVSAVERVESKLQSQRSTISRPLLQRETENMFGSYRSKDDSDFYRKALEEATFESDLVIFWISALNILPWVFAVFWMMTML